MHKLFHASNKVEPGIDICLIVSTVAVFADRNPTGITHIFKSLALLLKYYFSVPAFGKLYTFDAIILAATNKQRT